MMNVIRGSILLAILLAIGCNDFVGEGTVKPPVASSMPGMTALDRARAAINRHAAGKAVGSISLAGYSFSRELEIGGGLHVIVISSNRAGGLAVFHSDGSAVVTHPTNEITWVQLVDLDENGVSELVTEEIDGRGTGVLEKAFRLYRVTDNNVTEVWSGQSFRRHARDENHVEETIAFLRFDPSGAGRNARLSHLVVDASGRQSEAIFEWKDGSLHRVPN